MATSEIAPAEVFASPQLETIPQVQPGPSEKAHFEPRSPQSRCTYGRRFRAHLLKKKMLEL
jgi:hypothetical protein